MQNRLSGVDNGIGLAGDPCAGDPHKFSVTIHLELYRYVDRYVRYSVRLRNIDGMIRPIL